MKRTSRQSTRKNKVTEVNYNITTLADFTTTKKCNCTCHANSQGNSFCCSCTCDIENFPTINETLSKKSKWIKKNE